MKLILALVSFLMLSFGTASFAAEPISKDVSVKTEVAPKNAVNINTADIAELTRLKGIGEKKAEAIIAWRKENGNFKAVDDLLEVKGIGEATLEANRENIQI